jgi:c-di-GMP-related signal transduction protein
MAKEVEMGREDEMREAILRLSETYDPTRDFSSLVKDLGVSDSVEKALIKNRESVLELVNSNQALEAANKQLEIAIVKSNIEGDYTEGEKVIAAEVILQREKENQKGIEEARRNAETYRVNNAEWNKQ